MDVSTIGLDLAKSVFQVHGVDASGRVIICRQLRRAQVKPFFAGLQPCLVGMEACASAHHWARELMALGHEVRDDSIVDQRHLLHPVIALFVNEDIEAAVPTRSDDQLHAPSFASALHGT